MLNNEINEDFDHTEDEMPHHAAEAKEWIIATESRMKTLAHRATEWVKDHPKLVLGALLGVSAVGGGITYFVLRSRRASAFDEFMAAMKRFK